MLTSTPFTGDDIISLEQAREEVRLTADDSHHDGKLLEARDRAIAWAESAFGHSLQERSFVWSIDSFEAAIRLPRVPVTSVDEVNYYDAGVDTALDSSAWRVGGARVSAAYGTSWPTADGTTGGVRVTFMAGYPTSADIPPHLLGATRAAMAAFFENSIDPDLRGAMRAGMLNWVPVL